MSTMESASTRGVSPAAVGAVITLVACIVLALVFPIAAAWLSAVVTVAAFVAYRRTSRSYWSWITAAGALVLMFTLFQPMILPDVVTDEIR